MTMTETPTEAPKKKPKPRKKPRRASFQKPDAPKVAFPGLTDDFCATACNKGGCVISGRDYCGHPYKGALQTADMGNAAALNRLAQARKQLKMAVVDKQFT